jgi:hypothetical protein
MKTPTEVQADMIRELEAKVGLLLDDLFYTKSENAALRSRCDELEAERTQFANRAARLFAIEHELEESRKAERLARVQLQSEREARK